jgi:hypothetical protein
MKRWVSAGASPAALFAALAVLLGTWVVGMPLFTSPDEAAHLFKAYAVAHGEVLGDPLPGQSPNILRVDVPEWMAPPVDLACYFGQPTVPAACATGAHGTTDTSAGTYPPFWYAVVGGVVRASGQSTHQRAYRFVGALLCAALVAAALTVARRSRAGRFAPLVLLGLTPMAMFLAGGVNPNAFEIAGFVLLWSLLLVHDHPRAPSAVGGALVGGLAGAMLLARFASAIWLAAALVVAVVLLGRDGLRRFANRRFLAAACGTGGVAAAAVLWWSRYAGATTDNPATALDWTTGHVVRHTIGLLPDLTQEMIGVLGWLDTELPWAVYVLWAVLVAVAIGGLVMARQVRLGVAAALVVAGLAVVPVAVNVVSAAATGLIWQGRYSLPLFSALGVLGALAWSRAQVPDRVATMVRVGAATAFVAGQTIAFWAALRRFTVGTAGKVWLDDPLPWRPGVHPMLLVLVHLLAASALVALVLRPERAASGPIGPSRSASIPQLEQHG